jgi:hypothetical protein
VTLVSYTDAQYRNMEKNGQAQDMYVSQIPVMLPLQEDDTYSRTGVYTSIMALPQFEGSTEV